jgi:hypothetical protein
MTEKKTGSTRRTAKTIRNLRGTPVHLRLFGAGNDKPYRIELQPRGTSGDWHTVPASLTDDGTYVSGLGLLFEVIPTSEARAIQYQFAPVGLPPATVFRADENVVSREPEWDGTGQQPQRRAGAGPALADVLGSDAAMHESMREGNSALPEGAFQQTVTVEKV